MFDLLLAVLCLTGILALPWAAKTAGKLLVHKENEPVEAGEHEHSAAVLAVGSSILSDLPEVAVNSLSSEASIAKTNFSNLGPGKSFYISSFSEMPISNVVISRIGTETENIKSDKVVSLDQFRNLGKKSA